MVLEFCSYYSFHSIGQVAIAAFFVAQLGSVSHLMVGKDAAVESLNSFGSQARAIFVRVTSNRRIEVTKEKCWKRNILHQCHR